MRLSKRFFPLLKSILPVILLLALGGGIFSLLMYLKPDPLADESKIEPRRVRVLHAKKGPHRITVTAYGTTRAGKLWTAIAEVRGRTIRVDDRFEVGELLPAGTQLAVIDETDYRLAESQLLAEIESQRTQASELEQRKTNLQKIVELHAERVKLANDEFRRLRSLWEQKAASGSEVDATQSVLLGYQTAQRETQNQLDLIPAQKQSLDASLKVLNVQLQQTRRNLDKCEITLPFAARCASKSVELDEFVNTGERLGTFLALDTVEVVAMLETRKVQALFPGGIQKLGTFDLTQINDEESLFRNLDIPAEIRWRPGDQTQVWHGRVTRLGSGLDQSTRSIPVIIEIPGPYKDIIPGVRPPLVPDAFCHVTLFGGILDDVVLIPRDSLHEVPRRKPSTLPAETWINGADYCVYLVRDGKLDIVNVDVAAQEEKFAIIEQGIAEGDLVVLTDLFPVSVGMPLASELDETVNTELNVALQTAMSSSAGSPVPSNAGNSNAGNSIPSDAATPKLSKDDRRLKSTTEGTP